MKPALSSVLIVVFFIFIFKSIYSLYGIFQAPTCKKGEVCYKSILNADPKLDLYVFVSDNSRSGDFIQVLYEKNFDFKVQLEKYVFKFSFFYHLKMFVFVEIYL